MSKILETIHSSVSELEEAGHVDKLTMRKFDMICVKKLPRYTAEDVKRIREKLNTSQTVFAAVLGVGNSTVSQWEQGLKKPSRSAVRLLDLLDRRGLELFA